MKILSIETSCDDTAISVAECNRNIADFKIISQVISSQIEIHKKYGGVYPTLARREHQKNLPIVLKKVLKDANLLKLKSSKINSREIEKILEKEKLLFTRTKSLLEKYQKPDIDYIAVTYGPGLEPCLWSGINFARSLSLIWKIPIIPINHIEGHLFANFVNNPEILNEKIFPAVFLIVSGGHTQLILIEKLGKYKIIGETRDDAAGEAFDKIARAIGLPYPGGPEISKAALDGKMLDISLPRPMIATRDFDFSFSGLKTAVIYNTKKQKKSVLKSKKYISSMAFESQQAIIEVLVKKTIRAAEKFNVKTIIIGGGVAANKALKDLMEKEAKRIKKNISIPEIKLCTDNASMIALNACYHILKNARIKRGEIKAQANLTLS
ncbi:MAG: tRNA (adenosine(37)-N6)-threonylcarbamoyltransferase complex transferase subunit TsaD [Candidatus Paceibacterota bacterium]|jgi:N6-L-threonylcarbamoyladenine synthase